MGEMKMGGCARIHEEISEVKMAVLFFLIPMESMRPMP
jgi:hypothetical protein